MDMDSLNSECQINTPVQIGDFEDDLDEGSTSVRNDDGKKFNAPGKERRNSHSEIEKRRRDKINVHITELARILPMSPYIRSRKLDKLSVLKMTVQYMKLKRSTADSYTEGGYKQPLISNQDLNNLINKVVDGFIFAVSCHSGKIIYISKSVTQALCYSPEDLAGNNLFDYVHPKDVSKLREQLLCSNVGYKDSNTGETMPKMCSGTRRSFFCRMKRKNQFADENEADTITCSKNRQPDSQYSVIHCTGYFKSWRPINEYDNFSGKNWGLEDKVDDIREASSASVNDLMCLVVFGRVIDTSTPTSNLLNTVKPSQFTFKITADGKFLSVDHNITFTVGFLPQDLIGTSMFEYFHPDDIPRLMDVHTAALQECNPKNTEIYKFRTKDNAYIHLQSEWKSFQNPWTKEIEFITTKNNVIRPKLQCSKKPECSSQSHTQSNIFREQHTFESQYLQSDIMSENQTKSHIESCKFGKYVADTYLNMKKEVDDIESTPTLAQHDLTEEVPDEDWYSRTVLTSTMVEFDDACSSSGRGGRTYGSDYAASTNSAAQDNADQRGATGAYGQPAEGVLGDVISSPLQLCRGPDTNNAAEAVMLMDLLDAEAGLGGPVDHSGFPWPLP